MAEGGFDERTPFMEHTDEKGGGDDDDAGPGGNVSMGFNPGDPEAHSSPHSQRQTRLNTHDEIPSFFEPRSPLVYQQPLLLKMSFTKSSLSPRNISSNSRWKTIG